MRNLALPILAVMVLFVLVGCAPTSTPTADPMADMANPAATFCVEQGGQVDIRTGSDGAQTGYCVFPDETECEEWAYFRGECAPGAPDASDAPDAGIANPAATFCVEQGGQVDIRTGSDGGQAGYCVFPDGTECEEWAFFRGECTPGAPQPVVPESDVPTDDLIAAVQADLPAGAFEGLSVLPLSVPAGSPPLWAIFSHGLRNFELDPLVSHFVAIYTRNDAGWQELARTPLDQPGDAGGPAGAGMVMPDYIDPLGITQVFVEPSRVWLQVEGGVGAHGGAFELLSFDGSALRVEVTGSAASPGVGRSQDLNGDGAPEVVLDQSDAYVFCYACSVRKLQFQVFRWDSANQQLVEVTLQPFLMGQPQPMRDLVNPAVERAQAGLWKDALVLITQARQALSQYPESDSATLEWDYALIQLHAGALAQAVGESPYPLIANVFYGDYAAALDLMRAYTPEELFRPDSPLIVGTVAEGWASSLDAYIGQSATAALAVEPDLAAAYFLRGWAAYVNDPGNPQARIDVQRAAELASGDRLLVESAAYLP